ncbi:MULTISPECIES: response regulator [unclassified Maridesulfovibrio]|uniref:response regulator n=1 Tax=unclassified Maridesulfovibrio TaxID=2794999 RepID=UPI003B419F7A
MRILLVDDDAPTRDSLAEYLTLLGHAVTPSAEAVSALNICRNHDFEMVLSDIQMPGRTGMSWCVISRGFHLPLRRSGSLHGAR